MTSIIKTKPTAKPKAQPKSQAKKKPIYYLSGPMSGKPDLNYPAFRKAAKALRALGLDVFDPSTVFKGSKTRTRSEYMREDIRALLDADFIVFLPGWERSKGALVEYSIAVELKLPIRFLSQFVSVPMSEY